MSINKTTCDICGKEIIGVENFINAGDKVVCSEECKQKAYFNDYVEHCEIGMSVDDITEIKKMNEKLKKKPRMTCKQYCPVWDEVDKDCEIYGEPLNVWGFDTFEAAQQYADLFGGHVEITRPDKQLDLFNS